MEKLVLKEVYNQNKYFFFKKLIACSIASELLDSSLAKLFGLINGISAPSLLETSAIFSQSVET